MIGGWIKTILKEAGLETSLGSIRSAVASKSWLENIPVQEILNRGNWKSANTFKRHYFKQVNLLNQGTDKILFNNFKPI